MRYLALCTDYDGTIAHHGKVDAATIGALEELRASGRRLILVTGRELDDLQTVFDRLDLFDRVVAENGALIYRPAKKEERVLGEAPSAAFVAALRNRGVERISVGRSIVATWEPHEKAVLDAIRELGLELQVIFNKGAVMILPAGVNKASGLKAALEELKISIHNTVGVGDAENDHALLASCECSAAVSNALPSLLETADIALDSDHGNGVQALIREMLENDLADRAPRLQRHDLLLGKVEGGENVTLSPYSASALVVGTSGGGKSTVATGLLERLREKGYGFCIIDPEGDYDALEGATVLGGPDRAPSVDECVQLLSKPGGNAVINLLGLKLADRPAHFMSLFTRILDLRAKSGHPHWLIVDEAHHVLPVDWQPTDIVLPQRLDGFLMVSVSPALIAPAAVKLVDSIMVLGDKPREMLQEFATAKEMAPPTLAVTKIPQGQALLWNAGRNEPQLVTLEPTKTDRRRHLRKYAEGSLGDDRAFWFRGPKNKLKLRAQNLITFLDLADGVDEETWLHHWRKGEISDWLRRCVKDEELADNVAAVEREARDDATRSRERVRELIEAQYTAPADATNASQPSGSRA
jgi:HAD superfamily hydrolase (TIGR01484 family)